jgi:2-oxoglutarate ferredoxin oxidoreductase subunit beta
VDELQNYIARALQKEGFSLVEAISYCHTTIGRLNRWGTAPEMMRRLKEDSITLRQAERMSPEERAGKIIRGILADRDDLTEYTRRYYDEVVLRARREIGWNAPKSELPVRAVRE